MIKYADAELTSVLPPYIRDDADVQAISYAYQMAVKKAIEYAKTISLVASIDNMEGELLDLIALEMGTQYYSEDLNITAKRKLVKGTLAWYERAGTPSAVNELIDIIFGDGDIVEWFNYGEEPRPPYTFDIVTSVAMTEGMYEQFLAVLKKVKNVRSHVRQIRTRPKVNATWHVGSGFIPSTKVVIK